MLLRRIVLLYIVLLLCRIVFYCYNYALIGPLGWQEVLTLAGGGLKFDTVSVLYANLLFIVLSLLPFHFRERSWYRRILFWYYAVINSLLIVAVNLADCVYFRYTQKRFTADEIFFADNSNSVQLVLKFAAENWYLLLVGAVLIWLLVWGYGRKITPRSPLREGWVYHSVNTGLLVIAILLGIAGMRGGVTRMTRPITLSNATLYASTSEKANLILSNPFCILRTIGSGGSVKYTRYFSPEKLDEYFTPTHRPDSSAVNLEGRNVMVFILESMSAEHSAYLKPELYGNGTQPGYTPFLDSLMRQSLCFGQMYANGTRSIQAMPAVLGSIPSFKQPFVLMPQSLGKSRQLPQILRDKGYRTAFFCGSERGSMGFGAYARSASIERLLSREDYEAVHGTGDFDGYWGIWDDRSCNSRAKNSRKCRNHSSPRCSPSRRTIPSSCPNNIATCCPKERPKSINRQLTKTSLSGISTAGSSTKSGSNERSSSSSRTTFPRRKWRRKLAPIPVTTTSSDSSTPPTAHSRRNFWHRPCSKSTSCRPCWDCWETGNPISHSDATF